MSEIDLVTDTMKLITSRGFEPHNSPWDHKVCVMLHAAQGIIDNGGFEYFFGSSFPLDPDMSDFAAVFDAVGATSSAKAMREALERSRAPEPSYDDLNRIFWRESEANYALLTAYIEAHPDSYR